MKMKFLALLLAALMMSAPARAGDAALIGELVLLRPDAAVQHLRARPSDRAESLGLYFNGVTAQAAGETREGWALVSIGSLKGWLREEWLAAQPASDQSPEPLPVVQVAYQDGPSLTLRAAQSYKSEKIRGYPNGTELSVLGFTEDFVHVLTPDGRSGFMMAWGVSPQMSAQGLLPTPAPARAAAQEASRTDGPAPLLAEKASGGADESAPEPAPTPPADAELIRVKNAGGQGAALREKASSKSESFGLYPNGSKVYLLKWGEWWCRVWADGRTGYMMTKMLGVAQHKDSPPEATPAPVDTQDLENLSEEFDFVHWADRPIQGAP